jgi:cobalamin-dependent methionine synthase I
MHKAFAFCVPRGRWRLLEVKHQDNQAVIVGDDWSLESAAFAGFVDNATFLWLGAVTIGSKFEEFAANADNMTAAAVYDAVGSECADQAMDMLQKMSAQELVRHDLMMSKQRFSPGYGNLSLQVQKKIFEILQLEELGMSLTASNIMQPEKSVTAFAAVNVI